MVQKVIHLPRDIAMKEQPRMPRLDDQMLMVHREARTAWLDQIVVIRGDDAHFQSLRLGQRADVAIWTVRQLRNWFANGLEKRPKKVAAREPRLGGASITMCRNLPGMRAGRGAATMPPMLCVTRCTCDRRIAIQFFEQRSQFIAMGANGTQQAAIAPIDDLSLTSLQLPGEEGREQGMGAKPMHQNDSIAKRSGGLHGNSVSGLASAPL